MMKLAKRRKTPSVKIGNVPVGSSHPVVIQSMTNTPTTDVIKTLQQIKELINSGSEMVRVTINDDKAAEAVIEIIRTLRRQGYAAPIIGDFHFNGHLLLSRYPQMAKLLDKYRINPGNVGKGNVHDQHFAAIIKIAKENGKAIRIGVNSGSLDENVLKHLMDKNAKSKNRQSPNEVAITAMVKSALDSARYAIKLGLKKDKIILSAKTAHVQEMIQVNRLLAQKCDLALHLGLTEAGSGIEGITSSSAALAILLQEGVGDTIRVSLTPQPGMSRTQEVEVGKALLQSLGLRYFSPSVIICPGCGRTKNNRFELLANDVKKHIRKNLSQWKKKYPGIEQLTIAVMGCVVNGPGESKQADIGISLPGLSEKPSAVVFLKGKKLKNLTGGNIKKGFIAILEKFIKDNYSSREAE